MSKNKEDTVVETKVETEAETESVTVVENADMISDDNDDTEHSDLEEIFAQAVETADLEEGGEENGEEKVDESVTVETETVKEAKPSDDTTKAESEATETSEVTTTVEESATEKSTVEQPTVEPPPPLDPAHVVAEYQKWRGDAEELLAKHHYNWTEAQAEEFDTDPGSAMPKLAARLHMEVMSQSVAMMAQLIPQILSNVTRAQEQETVKTTEFFKQWPELSGHRDQVIRHGAVYMQMNPRATFDEFTRDVGAQVVVSEKVDLSGRQQQPESTPKTKAHKPISASGGPGNSALQSKPGLFEALDDDMNAYEQG